MATDKQTKLIVNLATRAGRLTTAEIPEASLKIAKYTPEETRNLINNLNAELGFDRGHSPATTRQRAFILDLEERVLGKWETAQETKLSYSDADERIQYLTKLEAARKPRPAASTAPVIDLFTRRAV